jgi:surfactin synthase thioesterase subunit
MLTPIKTIRLMCLRCAGGSPKVVRECCQEDCPGWPYRMGRNPRLAGRQNRGSFTKTHGLRPGKNSEST